MIINELVAGLLLRKYKESVEKSLQSDSNSKVVLLWRRNTDVSKLIEIIRRSKFYIPGVRLYGLNIDNYFPDNLSDNILVCIGNNDKEFVKNKLNKGIEIANLDYTDNPVEGWEWHNIALKIWPVEDGFDKRYGARLFNFLSNLKKKRLKRAYIFGTGPSLSKAIGKNWLDGYRIVCNTIVRDPKLFHHIDPDIIVAGDTIYHFGHTSFAKRFRTDLKKRLVESEAMFAYPAIFHTMVMRQFGDMEDRLLPIPGGPKKTLIIDFSKNFELPNLGNILPMLLLPLSMFLSKKIHLWGFDGRAPSDKLFWKNSSNHTYDHLMATLQKAHPAFFEYNVPKGDANKYIRSVQGDELDRLMIGAEARGWNFTMMHKSWTETLNKRFRKTRE